MAGARVEITKNTASPALKRLVGRLRGEGRQLLFADMGEYLLRSTRDRAALQVDPNGNKWRALSPDYARWKAKKRPGVPILKFDFHMLGDQLSYQAGQDELLVGTNAPYGAIHQFGGTIQRAAHSRKLAFGKDKPNRMKVFARAGSKDVGHEQWATVPAYAITLPARPWLGISMDDETELQNIVVDHLGEALAGD